MIAADLVIEELLVAHASGDSTSFTRLRACAGRDRRLSYLRTTETFINHEGRSVN